MSVVSFMVNRSFDYFGGDRVGGGNRGNLKIYPYYPPFTAEGGGVIKTDYPHYPPFLYLVKVLGLF